MCFFSRPKAPPVPPPLPPAPLPPTPPTPAPLPEAEVKPVNPAIKQAQSKLGTKKGQKGSTADLRIKKDAGTINTGNTNKTGGVNTP